MASLLPRPSGFLQRSGRRRIASAESALFAIGLLLAAGSSLFAAHSIAANTGQPRNLPAILPSGELMAWKRGMPGVSFARRDLDPVTTGSIASEAPPREQPDGAASRERQGESDGRRVIPTYVLLDVVDGVARVESEDGIRQVRPGSVLPGAGRVSSIERSGQDWVLVTSQGVIRDLR